MTCVMSGGYYFSIRHVLLMDLLVSEALIWDFAMHGLCQMVSRPCYSFNRHDCPQNGERLVRHYSSLSHGHRPGNSLVLRAVISAFALSMVYS